MPGTLAPSRLALQRAQLWQLVHGPEEKHLLVDIAQGARRNMTFTLPRFVFVTSSNAVAPLLALLMSVSQLLDNKILL